MAMMAVSVPRSFSAVSVYVPRSDRSVLSMVSRMEALGPLPASILNLSVDSTGVSSLVQVVMAVGEPVTVASMAIFVPALTEMLVSLGSTLILGGAIREEMSNTGSVNEEFVCKN